MEPGTKTRMGGADALGPDFARNERGGVLTMFALALPALLMGAGVVVDYGVLSTQKMVFQLAADSAALAAAREFRLANASAATVQTVAEKFATTALQAAKQTGKVAASLISGPTSPWQTNPHIPSWSRSASPCRRGPRWS